MTFQTLANSLFLSLSPSLAIKTDLRETDATHNDNDNENRQIKKYEFDERIENIQLKMGLHVNRFIRSGIYDSPLDSITFCLFPIF